MKRDRGKRFFSLLQSVLTGSGVHPASYPVGVDLFPRRYVYSARDVKLTTHLQLMPRLGTLGAVISLLVHLRGVLFNYARRQLCTFKLRFNSTSASDGV
jgi:hypothetical protein